MTRKKDTEIEFSTECGEAFDRLVALADQLAAMLTGDPLSDGAGRAATRRAKALAMGMVYFLLRADPRDLHATFFAKGSFAQCAFKPFPVGYTKEEPLAALL